MLRKSLLVTSIVLLLSAERAAALISDGGSEVFVQLLTETVASAGGGSAQPPASAVLSIDTAPSCNTAGTTIAVQDSVPIDANAWPIQATYRGSLTGSSGGVLRLAASCTLEPGGQSYQFQIPLFLCTDVGIGAVVDFSTTSCTDASLVSTLSAQGCPYLTSVPASSDPSGYSTDSSTETLQVFSAPLVGASPEITPALAVDIQAFYNGFSVAKSDVLLAPILVRVVCGALTTFQNS